MHINEVPVVLNNAHIVYCLSPDKLISSYIYHFVYDENFQNTVF